MTAPRGIVTPEAVLLEFSEAGVASRVLSISLDLVIQFVALFVLALVAGVAGGAADVPETAAFIFLVISVFLIFLGYPVIMETLTRGRTIGKMALGLRVVTVEGAPISFRHAAIRGALGLVDFYFPLPGGVVALLAVLFSRRGQRLGDLVAGTIVLRERSAAAAPAAYSFPPPPGYEGYASSLDVAALGDERYSLVRSFLLRVWWLAPGARAATALRLGRAVAAAINHNPPPQVHPEVFLVCVAAAYQARTAPQQSWTAPPVVAPPPPPPPPPLSRYPAPPTA